MALDVWSLTYAPGVSVFPAHSGFKRKDGEQTSIQLQNLSNLTPVTSNTVPLVRAHLHI